MNIMDDSVLTIILGVVTTAALELVSGWIGIVVGLLTAAFLVMKIIDTARKWKREDKEAKEKS